MGQCCSHSPDNTPTSTDNSSVDGTPKNKRIPRLSIDLLRSSSSKHKNKNKNKEQPKHHPLRNDQSSGSQSTPNNQNDTQPFPTETVDLKYNQSDSDDQSSEEPIDISLFQEDVIEFTEFWHQHYDIISRDSIHNALVKRIHNKVKEQYESFPRETVDEFITTLPELLEALETLINIAIDHDVEDAMSMYQQYQPLLVPNSVPRNNNVPSFPDNGHKRGRGRHRSKQNSLSIKLTPAYYENETQTKLCKLSAPPSPSRSKSRSRSKSGNRKGCGQILTDKDGIDIDDVNTTPPLTPENGTNPSFKTQIVVTKPIEVSEHYSSNITLHNINEENEAQVQVQKQINLQRKTHKKQESYSLKISSIDKQDSNDGMSPSPDAQAQEEAFTLFMGGRHGSFEDSAQGQQTHEHTRGDTVKFIQESQTHSSGNISADMSSDDETETVPLKEKESMEKQPRDILLVDGDAQIIRDDSFRFEMRTPADAELIMVGIMRTLWFDKVSKCVTKSGLQIEDLFFILSNALETALGTFREYKRMMEGFSLYIRQGLRTTLELIRAIIHDLSLNAVMDRLDEIYDDPYSILIHFADRCDIAVEFWNENIATLPHDIKLQLSMRVYSYAILNVEQKTYDRLKQKGAIVRWSTLLLDFMETIIRFFNRNRHQDLIEYLMILAIHHEKMKIPSTLLGNMGEWLDEVFMTHFEGKEENDIYSVECSDAINFVFAFVGEVMSGAYEQPIYDTANIQITDVADKIDENIPISAQLSHQISGDLPQIPTSFKSIIQMNEYTGDEEELTMHAGHYYNDTNYTLPNAHSLISNGHGHIPLNSYTFNNLKVTPKSMASTTSNVPMISNLDLDGHENLNDMLQRSATTLLNNSLKPTPVQTPSIGPAEPAAMNRNVSAPPKQHLHYMDDVAEHTHKHSLTGNMDNLRPPQNVGTFAQYLGGNSPLSQLDSPTISAQPTFTQPELTPNEASYEKDLSTGTVHDFVKNGGRAMTMTMHNQFPNINTDKSTLNVKDLREQLEQEQNTQRGRGRRGKKRSFSQADNYVMKQFLAPNSQNSYTNSGAQRGKSNEIRKNKKQRNKPGLGRKTSSSMLLDPRQEKNWKPMHFLQKIMDLEGRKIISQYAFAPSDGSLSEKIVDLSIFHQYFETAQQFWTRYIDGNINKINDKLLNVFSQRITDSVRDKISELFAQKQINFVQMFSLYFKLVSQYLDKCKNKAQNAQSINPQLLHAGTTRNNNNLPSLAPSLRHKPKSSNVNKGHTHKRTFSQRNSMSLGLSKHKLRGIVRESTGDLTIKHGHSSHNHFHSEGQFFVREMLRIGRKHRSHNIEEKTLKLVAKCLIEVIEKEYKRFNDRIKRAFTIALKLGIKFMCVGNVKKQGSNGMSSHRQSRNYRPSHSISINDISTAKTKHKQRKAKSRDYDNKPPVFRAKSAHTSLGFVD